MKMKNMSLLMAWMLLALLVQTGCDSTGNDPEGSITEDAAESVSVDLSTETAGLLAQFCDVSLLASDEAFDTSVFDSFDHTYDPATGSWTLSFSRAVNSVSGLSSGRYMRAYTYQYLDASGAPQQYYISDGDTAQTITFKIHEGTGQIATPRLSQGLTAMSADWVVTNANQEVLTLNGSYDITTASTLTTAGAERVLTETKTYIVRDVTIPRASCFDLDDAVTGTIEGTYAGNVTFTRGMLYSEQSLTAEVFIEFVDGIAFIALGDVTYESDLDTGGL